MFSAEWAAHLEPVVPSPVNFDAIDVRWAIEHLSPKERQHLDMFYWHGLSCAEIAQEFGDGTTTDAVYCTLSRARKRLKAHLTGKLV
jgi:DNA-directed RNA polymerase specialized sigma24 family protein